MQNNKAAIYIRVSSDMQVDGYSLDTQEKLCREWCGKHGYDVVQVYRDEGKSASSVNREEFQRMLAGANSGLFAAIVVYHTWRFSRNTEDGALIKKLEAQGVALVSVSEGGQTQQGASGKLQRNVTLAIGEYQLDQLREATRGGKQARMEAGISNASVLPFGYKRRREMVGDKIVSYDEVNEHAPLVREMFAKFATGNYSAQDLAHWLNAKGVTTTGVWGARAFSKDTVIAMLANAYYAGYVRYRGLSERKSPDGKRRLYQPKSSTTWKQGTHEPLISVELFDQCREVRAQRKGKMQGRKPARQRVFILSKLAYCAQCGGRLRGARWGKAGAKSEDNAYRCTASERGCKCGATYRVVPERFLLPELTGVMAYMRLPASLHTQAVAYLNQDAKDTDGAGRKQDKLEAELQRLNKMYQAGNVSEQYYDDEAMRIRRELADVAKSAQPKPAVDLRAAMQALDDMAALWGAATTQEKADIVRGLFTSFDVDMSTRRLKSFALKNEYAALLQAAYHVKKESLTKTEVTGLAAA